MDHISEITEFLQEIMVGDNACLREFTNVENQIKTKICGDISHVDVRLDILRALGTKRKAGAETTSVTRGGGEDLGRRDRASMPENANVPSTPTAQTWRSSSRKQTSMEAILPWETFVTTVSSP